MVSAASWWLVPKTAGHLSRRSRGVRDNKHHDFNGESCFVPFAVFVVWAANHKEEPRRPGRSAEQKKDFFPTQKVNFL
jgi:hypothetical protein